MLVALLAAAFAGNARAEHVAPVPISGNPTCADLGYAAGLRIDPVSGTYTIPGTSHTVTVQTDGTFLDWSSAAGLDAVLAKGSPEGNLYRYEPRSNGDTGLHAPINPVTGRPYALSHVDLCVGSGTPPPPTDRLQVSTSAGTSYTRTLAWQLTKGVDHDSHTGQAGNTFTSTYTVTVTKSVSESAFVVSGQITIHNPTATGATITGIVDSAGGTTAQVACSLPQDLAPGATVVCPYTAGLSSKASGTNTVTVETSGLVAGGSATADYAFGEPTTVVGDSAVVVTDTDPAGPKTVTVSEDRTFTYAKGFACSNSAADYSGGRRVSNYLNTVSAIGPATNLSAAATVQVDCRLAAIQGIWPADITVAISPEVVSAPVGSNVLFTVTVTNRGEAAASGVTATGSFSLASIASLTPNQGTCSSSGSNFTCSLGTLVGGGSATIQILARVLSGGNVVASANASGDNQAQVGASTIVVAIPTALPPPKLGVSVNLTPVSGVVLVNGKPLVAGQQIAVGAKVDTRKGIVNLQSFHGKFRFKNGLFQVRERRVRRGVTELVLLGGNFTRGCGHGNRALSGASSGLTHEKKVVRRLWGNGTGSFRTTGKYSSATVRGTIYLTADRCDGTLTQVLRGRVVVKDFALNKNVVLGPGQSYLAKPRSLRR